MEKQTEPTATETPSEGADSKKGTTGDEKPSRAGVPIAVFVENVEEFMKQPENTSSEVVLKRFDEQHTKYKFMEANLSQKKRRLRNQIPDIQKTLEMVQLLKKQKDKFSTHFLLSDNVYCTADVEPVDTVYLWLGANVMLEYSIDEALVLLQSNLTTAQTSLKEVEEDVGFISDQCTTLEVAMTRVYNWDVKERREKSSVAK